MTLSELVPAMAPESAMSTPRDWTDSEATAQMPSFTPNALAGRVDARTKMRLSVQMARLRAKLPAEPRCLLPPATTPRKSIENGDEDGIDTAAEDSEDSAPCTPPPPCNAFILAHNRHLVSVLLKNDGDTLEDWTETPVKERKASKRICGWDSSASLLCKKSTKSTVAAVASDNRAFAIGRAPQRRCATSSVSTMEAKIKINLYDRYTANAVSESFKFFHYSDSRLYIKQYRRNHACGVGQRRHHSSMSPVYDVRRMDAAERSCYNATATRDGYVLGVQTPITPHVWKASLPLPAFRHKFVKERKTTPEEPIISPRIFVRQNGAFSHLWKTKEDGTPDPSIAVTRPPTTQRPVRPTSTDENNKENQAERASPKWSPGRDSPGDLTRETPAWRIMQMIASSSHHRSRTDGSGLTTTNECTSRTSDIDSNLSRARSRDTGETSYDKAAVDASEDGYQTRIERLKVKYSLLSNLQRNESQVVYNRTRSILSNMSNLLSHYVDTQTSIEHEPESEASRVAESVDAKLEEAAKVLEREEKEASSRKQLVLLRRELKNIASRRSPSRQKLPSPSELAKVGSLMLPGSKIYNLNKPGRCSTTPQKTRKTPTREIRKISPSPSKTGHAGYKRVLLSAEQRDCDDKPILFVKRSQLLPTVSASVQAMKSRQMMLHSRTVHPADSKQFTKITDLLRSQIVRAPPSTGGHRRMATKDAAVPEARFIHGSYVKLD